MLDRLCVIANPGSGQNKRGDGPLEAAMQVLGSRAELRRWSEDGSIADTVRQALDDGFKTIIAAGGDGTIMSVAQALVGTDAVLGVLPLGTFNYFARGIGLPEDSAEAARALLRSTPRTISVGEVNGQLFLNNASVGIYPHILNAREETYRRFGRNRLLAYWSVLRTFLNFQRPRKRTITVAGQTRTERTPLIFVARSAYQLAEFGLAGIGAIEDDKFAVFIIHPASRIKMFILALRLVRHRIEAGRDVDVLTVDRVRVDATHPTELVAHDGEKMRMSTPLTFEVRRDALRVLTPAADP